MEGHVAEGYALSHGIRFVRAYGELRFQDRWKDDGIMTFVGFNRVGVFRYVFKQVQEGFGRLHDLEIVVETHGSARSVRMNEALVQTSPIGSTVWSTARR